MAKDRGTPPNPFRNRGDGTGAEPRRDTGTTARFFSLPPPLPHRAPRSPGAAAPPLLPHRSPGAASKQRAHVIHGRAGRERAPAPRRMTRRPRGSGRRRRKRRHARAPARRPRDAVTRAAPPPSRRAGRGRGEAPPPQRGGAADPGAEQDGPPGPMAGEERGPRGRVTAGNGPGRARRGWGRGGGGGTVLLPRNCPLRPSPSWRRGSGRHVTGAGAGRGAGTT